jgi:hypothetical protein
MKTLTEPVGTEIDWFDGSTIAEITNSRTGLRIVIQAAGGEGPYAEVHFPFALAFQAMDEGDMVGLIDASLSAKRVAFRVLSGGWKDGVSDRYLMPSSGASEFREWLVVSDIGQMVSVISFYEPHVRQYGRGPN